MNVLFFKQKTAYEMRMSDWSSDVCSSDLNAWFSPLVRECQRGASLTLVHFGGTYATFDLFHGGDRAARTTCSRAADIRRSARTSQARRAKCHGAHGRCRGRTVGSNFRRSTVLGKAAGRERGGQVVAN